MDFHYQLFRNEHKSYYTKQDLEILNECRTTANVGWTHGATQGQGYTTHAIYQEGLSQDGPHGD
jgi:hypothetical protein